MNTTRPGVIKNYALRHLAVQEGCLYAVYGISVKYKDPDKDIVNYAKTPHEIEYFFSEEVFHQYVNSLIEKFKSAEDIKIHYVSSTLNNNYKNKG